MSREVKDRSSWQKRLSKPASWQKIEKKIRINTLLRLPDSTANAGRPRD